MKPFVPWKVLHLSIHDPCSDLLPEAGVGGLFVVLWCHGIPLGQRLIPAALLPIPSAQLSAAVPSIIARAVGNRLLGAFQPSRLVPPRGPVRLEPLDLKHLLELDRPLERLARAADPAEFAHAAPISVVICTRNRPERLEKCLSSIRGLSPGPQEIVVVDNDPASGLTQPVVERFPEVSYVREPRLGLSAARNAGVLNCRGAIVAFTDDDAMVHPGWIQGIGEAFRDRDMIAMTGLVLPAELATRAQYIFQVGEPLFGWEYCPVIFGEAFFASTKHRGARVWTVGAGANMAFRREAFERVGLFDERLGAGAAGCSEDSEMWYRLLAEGHQCVYAPTAVVFHYHRTQWEELRHQTYSYMRGHVAALFFQFDRYRHWGNIYRALVALPWYLVRVACRSAKGRAGRSLFYGSDEEWLSPPLAPQILGVIAGYGYYLRHRLFRAHGPAPRGHLGDRSQVDPQI
jgi:GT2 family glycosyltransferase